MPHSKRLAAKNSPCDVNDLTANKAIAAVQLVPAESLGAYEAEGWRFIRWMTDPADRFEYVAMVVLEIRP